MRRRRSRVSRQCCCGKKVGGESWARTRTRRGREGMGGRVLWLLTRLGGPRLAFWVLSLLGGHEVRWLCA